MPAHWACHLNSGLSCVFVAVPEEREGAKQAFAAVPRHQTRGAGAPSWAFSGSGGSQAVLLAQPHGRKRQGAQLPLSHSIQRPP